MTSGSLGRRLETVAAAVVWVILTLSLAVIVMTLPRVTSLLVDALDVGPDAGLTAAQARDVAESVRAFVTSSSAPELPAIYAGRKAFDEAAVSHLIDVRRVLGGIRALSGVAALLLVAWIGWSAARSRWRALSRAVEAGGWATLGTVAAIVVFALVGFGRAFEAMHGLFFAPGTWQFPADSLLIQVFPEPFWMAMGGMGAAFALLGGGVLLLAGSRLRARTSP